MGQIDYLSPCGGANQVRCHDRGAAIGIENGSLFNPSAIEMYVFRIPYISRGLAPSEKAIVVAERLLSRSMLYIKIQWNSRKKIL